MGILNCVHRPQNYSVTLEMIEGTVLCPQDFGVSFFFIFCFLVLNCFLFYFKILKYFLFLFLIIIVFNLIIFYFIIIFNLIIFYFYF